MGSALTFAARRPDRRPEGLMSMILRAFSSLTFAGAAAAATIAMFVLLPVSADAATKKTDTKEAKAKPSLVATFGDWNVFVGQAGKGRICYTLAQPKTRNPSSLKRDSAYAFISDRPAEGVRNEVSFIMGFDVSGGTEAAGADAQTDAAAEAKPESKSSAKGKAAKAKAKAKAEAEAKAKTKAIAAPVATVGDASFELLPKGANLWVKNAARESALIAEMKKGASLEIRAASVKGAASTDTYSLTGFSQAMDRLQKECPTKT
jgi:invasion protein IalB